MSAERLRELAVRLQRAEHERVISHVQVPLSDRMPHGSAWPGHISNRFEDCAHPDCVLVRSALGDTGRATPAPEIKCAWCGEDIRCIDGEWLDRETHASCDRSDEAVVKHAPAALPLLDLDAYADELGAHFMASENTQESERASIRPILQRLIAAAVRAPSWEGRELAEKGKADDNS